MCKDMFFYSNLIHAASFRPKLIEFPDAWIGHLPFAAWLMQEVSPKIFVELGTHSGNSYFSFCQSVLENDLPAKCFAVDTWQGDEHAGHYSDEVFFKVNAYNMEHYAGFSRLLRMTFDESLNYFADGSIDLLHIDGLHTYEAVKNDFETWLPKLAPGAFVLFHDTNVRERGFGVWKLWEELQTRYPKNLEFLHSNGLGVLQLNNAVETRGFEWLQPNSSDNQQLIDYFSALGGRQLDCFDLIFRYKPQVTKLNQDLFDKDEQIAQLQNTVTYKDEQIASFLGSRSWRMTSPLRAVNHLLISIKHIFGRGAF